MNSSQSQLSSNDLISLHFGDVMDNYDTWDSPDVIVSDGPYGISSYTGDLKSWELLAEWYKLHAAKWFEKANVGSTLWFWNTEIGWASVHPILVAQGWTYKGCNVWDKGIAHIAGNHNSQKASKLPVVTEVCAQYVKEPQFTINGAKVSTKHWLRHEWQRAGLPLSLSNAVTGTKNAATRKYLTQCHLWYSPPGEHFHKLSEYANTHGEPSGRPYFSVDGIKPLTGSDWDSMKPKFYCPFGVTNVWSEPPVSGRERLKIGSKAVHINQKPLRLMDLIVRSSSDKGDVVWEPFGGLCSAAISAAKNGRRSFAAEIDKDYYQAAAQRISDVFNSQELNLELGPELTPRPSLLV